MFKLLGLKGLMGAATAVAVVAGGSYAFTASNIVPSTQAGQGTGTVSGYTCLLYTSPSPRD